MQKRRMITSLGVCIALLAVSCVAFAQPPQQNGGGRRRGNFDPAQMRQRMMERVMEQLGVSADEWKVIGPRYEKVMTLERQVNSRGGMFGRFGRGGRGGRGFMGQEEETAVSKATDDLQTVLDQANPSPDDIKAKLTALRQAREKAKQELAAAQAQLKEVLSLKQEAILVMQGTLP